MSCISIPLSCAVQVAGGVAGRVIGSAAGSVWNSVCKSFADAAAQLLGAFGKAFVAIPPVNLESAGVRNVYGISLGLAGVIAALLLLGQVIRTAFTHDGSALAQGLTGVGKAALAFLLTLTVAGTALVAADELTGFIVTQTLGSTQALSDRIATLVAWDPKIAASLLLVFAVIGILLVIVLWFEMLLRNAAIAVLVATSPIAAAGQVSEAGKGWWPKLAASAGQLIVLKPVIALVFCLGLSLTGESSDIETLLAGMLVLLLAAVAWPAVARFFAFTSIQVGGGAGLGAMLGFAAGRMASRSGVPAGTEPDEFSRVAEARTMARMQGAAELGSGGRAAAAGAAGFAGGAFAAGPAGMAAAGLGMAQRAVNSLTGRMEQMAGHAGIQGANPYAQPAGPPRLPAAMPAGPGAPSGAADPGEDSPPPPPDPAPPPPAPDRVPPPAPPVTQHEPASGPPVIHHEPPRPASGDTALPPTRSAPPDSQGQGES